jgi:hypothetical protein
VTWTLFCCSTAGGATAADPVNSAALATAHSDPLPRLNIFSSSNSFFRGQHPPGAQNGNRSCHQTGQKKAGEGATSRPPRRDCPPIAAGLAVLDDADARRPEARHRSDGLAG